MKVSCIIPAFNEEKRITAVIRAAVGHELVDEVIVVNDCSTDGTQEVLEKEPGITIIKHEKNQGKTAAVTHGLEIARNDLVMFLDADLVGLNPQNLTELISPVIQNQADMSLSMRGNSLGVYKFIGIDFVSGERVFNKKIIGDLNKLYELNGYGLEVFLNNIVLKKHLRLKIVNWPGVVQTLKQKKIGVWRGLKGEVHMIGQVLSTVGIPDIARQLIGMRKLRV